MKRHLLAMAEWLLCVEVVEEGSEESEREVRAIAAALAPKPPEDT